MTTKQKYSDKFKAIQKQASSGHYLDRLIAIADATEAMPLQVNILKAFKAQLNANCKPAGLDEYILECTETVLYMAQLYGLESIDIRPIAWGLNLKVLQRWGLESLRV